MKTKTQPPRELLITGLACRLPESPSTQSFWENLVAGVDMISKNDEHWARGFGGNLPDGKGLVRHQDLFDNLFFKMSGIQAQKTDPQLRFLLELSYEALVDAGMDITKIRGSNAGVYVGSCFSDCHKGTWVHGLSNHHSRVTTQLHSSSS